MTTIAIYIDGKQLELEDNVSIQFQKENSIFAFDNLKTERTTTISVPATTANNAILKLAGNEYSAGAAMRNRHAASVFVNGVQSNGYLYVTKYNIGSRSYDCVFITGENLEFKKIKEAGKIKNITSNNTAVWAAANERQAYQSYMYPFSLVKYVHNGDTLPCFPSINLKLLFEDIQKALGTSITLPRILRSMGTRYVPNKLQTIQQQVITLSSTQRITDLGSGDVRVNDSYSTLQNVLKPDTITYPNWLFKAQADDGSLSWFAQETTSQNELAGWQVVGGDLYIKFPDEFPSNVCMVSALNPNKAAPQGDSPLPADFIAGAGAGKTVFLKNGQKFAFVRYPEDYNVTLYPTKEGETSSDVQYWAYNGARYLTNGQPSYAYIFKVSVVDTNISVGDTIYEQAVLPDWDVIDLLHIFSALTGYQLYVNESGNVAFATLGSFSDTIDLTGCIIERQTLERTFGDYGQHNIIEFEETDDVLSSERVSVDYTLQNDYLTEENVLQAIPAAEGGRTQDSNGKTAALLRTNEKGETSKANILVYRSSNTVNLSQPSLTKSATLQSWIDKSTKVVVVAYMKKWQYNKLQPLTAVVIDGAKYVWIDAKWSDNKSTLTLQKVN